LVSSSDIHVSLIIATEKITGESLELISGMGEKAQKHNLTVITKFATSQLEMDGTGRWSVDGMMKKDISSMMCFLVDLAHALQCPYPLPSDVSIAIVAEEVLASGKKSKTTVFQITKDETEYQLALKMASMGSMNNIGSLAKLGSMGNFGSIGNFGSVK
jgi:parvin